MDENILVQFLKQAKRVNLSPVARKSGRERLLAAIDLSSMISDTRFPVYSGRFILDIFRLRQTVLVGTLVCVLVLTASIGTGLAAEKSLPGSVLYPIKTNINERILGGFALSDQAKIDWQMKRIERRIAEADTLVSEGRFDDRIIQDIENLASQQIQDVDNLTQKFENNNNDIRAIEERLRATLQSSDRVRVEVSDQKVTIRERHDEDDNDDNNRSVEIEEESADESLNRDSKKDDERFISNESVSTDRQTEKETTKDGGRKKIKNTRVSSQEKNTESTSAKSSLEIEKKQGASNNSKNSESSADISEENDDEDQEDSSADDSE